MFGFGTSRHDSLDSLKKVINKHASQFLLENDGVSYDSFYKDLLSDLHECLKHKDDRSKSIITDVFYGQFRRELTCPICGSTKTDFIPYSIISPTVKKSVKVIYISLRYTDDYIKMNIEIPPHSSFAVISKIFSNYLKKDVKVVLGTYRIMDEIEWELHDYDGISQPHICAFEVENFDSYLIPCKISMKEKSTNFPKIIGKPFLLSFDHPDPTEEEISNCAFNHLKCLWDTNDEPDPTEYIKNIVENENYYSESVENKFINKPIVAKISENNLRGKQLHFDSKYPNLEKSIIDINLNPLFMKNDSITKFSYYKLYCNLKPKIEKPISKISLKNSFSNLCRTSNLGYGNEWKCSNCNQDVCAIF